MNQEQIWCPKVENCLIEPEGDKISSKICIILYKNLEKYNRYFQDIKLKLLSSSQKSDMLISLKIKMF